MVTPRIKEITEEQINKLLDRVENQELSEDDYPLIADLIRSMAWLSKTIEEQNVTMHRLRKIFNFKTEKTSSIKDIANGAVVDNASNIDKDGKSDEDKTHSLNNNENNDNKKKRKGNRPSKNDYKSAVIINIAHENIKIGNRCQSCLRGNLRKVEPGVFLRIIGQPFLQAHLYNLERFRCNTCGKIFTAKLPEDIARAPKYDNAAKAIVSLLKYRGGVPFYRQESLQKILDTPISDSVLWEMTNDLATCLEPVFEVMIMKAATGKCFHNDDTKARILELMQENKSRNPNKERVGINTSAILSKLNDVQIALFFTGRQHAGENLDNVLDNRPQDMPIPIQMCDASSNNSTKNNKTYESNCISHLRRKFFDIVEIWPKYILPIIMFLNKVFSNDREAKQRNLNEMETFELHKEKSATVMADLKKYCQNLINDKKTEPSSNLGKSINYMLNHWEAFTLFLRKPGVPIDNNEDERLMKRAVLNRKNGLFFKTESGAHVGDVILSFIETCQLNNINPYYYFIAVQDYRDLVEKNPEEWLPWNYEKTLSKIKQDKDLQAKELEQEISPEMIVSSLSPA